MTGISIHVIAKDFQVFGRVVAHLLKFQLHLTDVDIGKCEEIHATFDAQDDNPQISLDIVSIAGIIDAFLSLEPKGAIQRDALRSLSKIILKKEAEIRCSDGRILMPITSDEDKATTIPDPSKEFRPQSFEISDGRLCVTLKGERASTYLYLSAEDRLSTEAICRITMNLNRTVERTLTGEYQQVCSTGSLKSFLLQLMALTEEVNRNDLILKEYKSEK